MKLIQIHLTISLQYRYTPYSFLSQITQTCSGSCKGASEALITIELRGSYRMCSVAVLSARQVKAQFKGVSHENLRENVKNCLCQQI